MDLQKLIRQLEQGICPAELSYRADAQEEIDWEKVAFHSTSLIQNSLMKLKKMPVYDKKSPKSKWLANLDKN